MDELERTFLELVRENRGRLRRICRVYGEGPEDARDLRQEILAEAWRTLPSFRGDSSPSTWLYRVALNTALARRRKRRARSDARLDPDDPILGADVPPPDGALDETRRLERLEAAIERLDDPDRALILLWLDDVSYARMSEIVGISESYVGVKLHRIREKLSGWLETPRQEEPT